MPLGPPPVTVNSTWRRLTPGSLIRTSASVPRPIDQTGGLQRVAGAVDLEHRASAARLGVGGVAGHRGLGATADAEPAGGQVVGLLEDDADRSREDVALLVGMVAQLLAEVVAERRVVRREPLQVGLRELDVEVVGDQPSVPAEDLCVVVALALQGRGDLDRLHRGSERLGKGTGDHLLELVLQSLEPTHVPPFRRLVPVMPSENSASRRTGHPDRRPGCDRSYRWRAGPVGTPAGKDPRGLGLSRALG